MAAIALIVARGRPGPAAAVIGGWILIELGYRSIVSGVDTMLAMITGSGGPPAAANRRRAVAAAAFKLTGRYALLAFLAYVMIARLRLHPLGLIAGASSAVVAVSIEAIRLLVKQK